VARLFYSRAIFINFKCSRGRKFIDVRMTQGQEVEFHEIKIQLFQEIEFLIMRSKLCLFMRSNLSNNIDQEVDTLIMRSNFHNNAV